ncbi:MAG: hypothetical protein DMF93_12330 [Acidobacteria bacterium]|nr:MAG: hypothetical protein DMF93_12330 [Acidobacteriota bacterium]
MTTHLTPSKAGVVVVRPGMLTTVQDSGRWGLQARGVPVGGPMDGVSHRLANALVRNPPTAAGLEITLLGPELEFDDERVVAVAGAQFDLLLAASPCRPRSAAAPRISSARWAASAAARLRRATCCRSASRPTSTAACRCRRRRSCRCPIGTRACACCPVRRRNTSRPTRWTCCSRRRTSSRRTPIAWGSGSRGRRSRTRAARTSSPTRPRSACCRCRRRASRSC